MATKGMTVFTHEGEDYTVNDPNIANEFSTSATYAIGDYVYHNGNLYRCISAITTAESWTAAHWRAITVGYDSKLSCKVYTSLPNYITSCDDVVENGVVFVSVSGGVTGIPDFPIGQAGWLKTYIISDGIKLQEAVPYDVNISPYKMIRMKQLAGGWKEWVKIPIKISQDIFDMDLVNAATAFDVIEVNGLTFTWKDYGRIHVEGTSTSDTFKNIYADASHFPFGIKASTHITAYYSANKGRLQIFYYKNGDWIALGNIYEGDGSNFERLTIPSDAEGLLFRIWFPAGTEIDNDVTFHIWTGGINEPAMRNHLLVDPTTFIADLKADGYQSCDDVESNGVTFCSVSGGAKDNLLDFPLSGAGWLFTSKYKTLKYQIAYPYLDTDVIKYRHNKVDGTYSNWVTIGQGSTTTIVEEVSRDTYNNTYNLDVSPSITTDTNGWLQAVDTDTQSETGKTDMTGAIMAMLTETGYCHLSPGIFYVSGNIDMPANSMLEGCGKQTIIRLLQNTESGYIARMHTRSTIKNVCFSGGYSAISIDDGNIGGRKGINYIGNRDGQSTGVTPSTCTLCQIDGCWFENLDSGIYGYNAGGGVQEGLEVSNCYFTRCKAGINFDYWTEYSKFTNCVTFQCYYGCINNGGNNVFMNCTFHGVIGFVIDNSSGEKANNAHGSVIGCTFNHIDNMHHSADLGKGIAIKVLNTSNGYLFANCQVWYGKIHIESSSGIQISGFEFGGGLTAAGYNVIETTGTGMVFIDNCLFQATPNLSLSSPAKITNCWTYDGNAVTG